MPPPRDVKKQQSLNDDEKRILADRYRVEKKLGSGNFGTAFLVTDLKDNQELKVLKEVSIGDMQPDESIESVHEANLLSTLDHPNILKYYDSFLDGEYFCIVTEYCEGGDLDVLFKKLKKENQRLSEEKILDWTVQLLSALHYMHSRRVLHRDLKARNIFLRRDQIKIGDFGISRILQGTMDMASTFTGTPYYMSPEVLKHEGYNSKSDVWSVGCLLYEMCTYQHAFEGQGLMGVMYKIVEGKIPELPNSYSKELNIILKKIFRKDPNIRPGSIELLREPFVARHIQNMMERYKSNKPDDLDSTIVLKNDRSKIAEAVNAKISLKDLQTRRSLTTLAESSLESKTAAEKFKTAAAAGAKDEHDDDDDVRSGVNQPVYDPRPKTSVASQRRNSIKNQAAPPAEQAKNLTPKERLILNKINKANEEAAKLSQVAKENYEERILRDTFRREATVSTSIHNWNPAQKPQTFESNVNNNLTYLNKKPQADLSRDEHDLNKTRARMNELPPQTEYYPDFENDEEGTLLKTVQYYPRDESPDKYVQISSTIKEKMPQPKVIPYDSRPIKPMKTRVESVFDDDGIPSDPQLTNEYYKNFEDFENDSSPERKTNKSTTFNSSINMTRNSMSKTVAPKRRVNTAAANKRPTTGKFVTNSSKTILPSKTFSSRNTTSGTAKADNEQLLNAMQNLFTNDKMNSFDTFGDDSKTSVFGANARATKIQNLRSRAMRVLGPEKFDKVYNYLKEQRFGAASSSGANIDENKIFEGLKQFTPNPSDCFLVDQLVFLEQ